jgi:hypothetical protein
MIGTIVFLVTYSTVRDLGGGEAGQEDEREDGGLHLGRLREKILSGNA